MNYNKIKLLAEKKKLSQAELCRRTGISPVGFIQMIQNDRMKISVLEKIAEVLGVSPEYFFSNDGKPEDYQAKDRPANYEKKEPVSLERETELLKELILEKDKRLKLLEEKNKIH